MVARLPPVPAPAQSRKDFGPSYVCALRFRDLDPGGGPACCLGCGDGRPASSRQAPPAFLAITFSGLPGDFRNRHVCGAGDRALRVHYLRRYPGGQRDHGRVGSARCGDNCGALRNGASPVARRWHYAAQTRIERGGRQHASTLPRPTGPAKSEKTFRSVRPATETYIQAVRSRGSSAPAATDACRCPRADTAGNNTSLPNLSARVSAPAVRRRPARLRGGCLDARRSWRRRPTRSREPTRRRAKPSAARIHREAGECEFISSVGRLR